MGRTFERFVVFFSNFFFALVREESVPHARNIITIDLALLFPSIEEGAPKPIPIERE